MGGALILLVAGGYMALLFAIAYWGDKWAAAGRGLMNNPYIYALSLAVYCTAWTFYGSVGRAASSGLGFLPMYLGATLMAFLWVAVLRKIIRISKENRITTIADFIGSRYGKSTLLSGLVTVIAVVGIVPYLSLQLKAIATSFDFLWTAVTGGSFLVGDTALFFALMLALFALLFGTRNLDATEHHQGVVLAIAFESLVKLVAFLLVGVFVTFVLFSGPAEIFSRAGQIPHLRGLMESTEAMGSLGDWAWLVGLSMLSVILLPRQFHMAVVENVDERHLTTATWLFPLYLLLINLFVLPIAFAGSLLYPGADADFYVLTLPLGQGHTLLGVLAFVGGLSASTGMVIVTTIALSTMVSNDLVMPFFVRSPLLRQNKRENLSGLLLWIRRVAIVAIILLAYAYYSAVRGIPLVSIGLISFAAVAQFAPALLGGMYWKRGTWAGACTSLGIGFAVWAFTLPFPSLLEMSGASTAIIEQGVFGLGWLRPYALFGLEGLSPLTHSLLWSLLLNGGSYVIVSLLTEQTILERTQVTRFVTVFERSAEMDQFSLWYTPSTDAVEELLQRFLGRERVQQELAHWRGERGKAASAQFLNQAEKLLASVIGAPSAHILINTVVARNKLTMDEVMSILDETSQILHYSRQLEQQSRELADRTQELRIANERLRELDTMKSDFVSTVTHELRTPLTSIRAFTEILYDNPELAPEQRAEFLGIIQSETERLTRLIDNVLDLSKIESGSAEWLISEVDINEVVQESLAATSQLFHERQIEPEVCLLPDAPPVAVDRDRIVQVLLNLLSNAIKFSDPEQGRVQVAVHCVAGALEVSVRDNGRGLRPEEQERIFEKFQQAANGSPATGTGLGLSISKQIIEHFAGRLWVESEYGQGACFRFTLPLSPAEALG